MDHIRTGTGHLEPLQTCVISTFTIMWEKRDPTLQALQKYGYLPLLDSVSLRDCRENESEYIK